MPSKTEKPKDTRIEAKLSIIERLFKELPENKKTLLRDLMTNAAFMAVALEDLQEDIKINGVVEHYQNGANQFGKKQSAAMQSYNTLIKNYKLVMEGLAKELPEAIGRSKLDEYLELVNNE